MGSQSDVRDWHGKSSNMGLWQFQRLRLSDHGNESATASPTWQSSETSSKALDARSASSRSRLRGFSGWPRRASTIGTYVATVLALRLSATRKKSWRAMRERIAL